MTNKIELTRRSILLSPLVLLLAGCGGGSGSDNGSPDTGQNAVVTGLSASRLIINPANVTNPNSDSPYYRVPITITGTGFGAKQNDGSYPLYEISFEGDTVTTNTLRYNEDHTALVGDIRVPGYVARSLPVGSPGKPFRIHLRNVPLNRTVPFSPDSLAAVTLEFPSAD